MEERGNLFPFSINGQDGGAAERIFTLMDSGTAIEAGTSEI